MPGIMALSLGAHYRKYSPHQGAQESAGVKAHMPGSCKCESLPGGSNRTPVPQHCDVKVEPLNTAASLTRVAPALRHLQAREQPGGDKFSGQEGRASLLRGLAWHPGQSHCGWLARPLEGKILGGMCEQDWSPGRGRS